MGAVGTCSRRTHRASLRHGLAGIAHNLLVPPCPAGSGASLSLSPTVDQFPSTLSPPQVSSAARGRWAGAVQWEGRGRVSGCVVPWAVVLITHL